MMLSCEIEQSVCYSPITRPFEKENKWFEDGKFISIFNYDCATLHMFTSLSISLMNLSFHEFLNESTTWTRKS